MIIIGTFSILLSANPEPTQRCDFSSLDRAREVHEALSRRAIEVVARALDRSGQDAELAELVSQSATFSLGAGDVGRPLAKGSEGARALATLMQATSYRYYGWNYMNRPADGCAAQTVTVDFINDTDNSSSSVVFGFDQGRIVSAEGWQRGFEAGPLIVPTDTASPAP